MENNQNKDVTKRVQHSLNRPIFFLFPAIIGLLIVFIIVMTYQKNYNLFASHDKYAILYVFCDANFIAGVIIGGIGGLLLISGEGFFDMIAFGVTKAFQYLFVTKERRNNESFIDYKLRKEAERSGGRIWFVAVVGAVFLLIAFFTSIPFWNVSQKKIEKGYDLCYEEICNIETNSIEVVSCDYKYVRLYQDMPQYNGTVVYSITYTVDSIKKTTYYVWYIDENTISTIPQTEYIQIASDFVQDHKNISGTIGTLK